jgi:N-acyl homoserine lactone hydrolase
MKIHAIETGKVKITQNWRTGRGQGIKRLANTLFDKEFTTWLPIYTWLIEHPEGLILVDTGIPADANKRIWFPPFMPLLQRVATFQMTAEQEVGPQLRRLGIAPEDVRRVVLTHLHQDHDGGLHHFPHAEFIVSAAEWEAGSGFKGRMNGYLNQRWSKWFQPTVVNLDEPFFGPFSGQHQLTDAGDIHLVPTPGHSAGHMSVILEEGDLSILFAGDASYTEDLLLAGRIDGVAVDPAAQQDSHRRIVAYAEQTPTVYLPSHDPDAAERLRTRRIIERERPLTVKVY